MECPSCKNTTPGIVEGNHLWCDKCGVSIREHVEYVPSYNSRYTPSQQVYSRVKRFLKYLHFLNVPMVLHNIHAILDLYSSFEFTWTCNREKSKRQYFYAKPVMAKIICRMLEIDVELPSLKDKSREIEQYTELAELIKTTAFQLSSKRCLQSQQDFVDYLQ
jgi:hypothetical protein